LPRKNVVQQIIPLGHIVYPFPKQTKIQRNRLKVKSIEGVKIGREIKISVYSGSTKSNIFLYLIQYTVCKTLLLVRGFGTFLQVLAVASHWLEDCANYTSMPEENDFGNTAPTVVSANHFYLLTVEG
jgi:hypothetical protein